MLKLQWWCKWKPANALECRFHQNWQKTTWWNVLRGYHRKDYLRLRYENTQYRPTEDNKIKLKIVSPSGDVSQKSCSFCKKEFKKDDEKIDTCTHTEYVTLCRPCYDKAGNSVR